MSHHVFAWIAGYGWTLMPLPPYRFAHVPDRPRSVWVQHTGPDGAREAVVTVSSDGERIDFELGPDTQILEEVLDATRGAAYPFWTTGEGCGSWWVETAILRYRWPQGFSLQSLPGIEPPVFDLVGPEDARIWIQGPLPVDRVPPLDGMAGPGQTTERVHGCAGGPLVELTYEYEGVPWRMFHCVLQRRWQRRRTLRTLLLPTTSSPQACVVTAQTPELHADRVRAAVEEVASTLTPCLV